MSQSTLTEIKACHSLVALVSTLNPRRIQISLKLYFLAIPSTLLPDWYPNRISTIVHGTMTTHGQKMRTMMSEEEQCRPLPVWWQSSWRGFRVGSAARTSADRSTFRASGRAAAACRCSWCAAAWSRAWELRAPTRAPLSAWDASHDSWQRIRGSSASASAASTLWRHREPVPWADGWVRERWAILEHRLWCWRLALKHLFESEIWVQ